MGSGKKHRVLVIASTYPRWQGDHEPGFVHELSKRLVDKLDVMVVCPHAPGSLVEEEFEGVKVRRFRYAPVKFESLVNEGGIVTNLRKKKWKFLLIPLFMMAMCWSVYRNIRIFKPDVVHVHWLIPQGAAFLLLKLLGVEVPPYLVTSHGADLFSLKGFPFFWIKKKVIENAGAVSVVSQVMVNELEKMGARKDQVSVKPMGVDLRDLFVPNNGKAFRKEKHILFVGRLVEKKGARFLIEAAPYILKKHSDAKILIVGFGPELPVLKSIAKRLNIGEQLVFLGPKTQREVRELYRNADVFVAPFIQAKNGDQEGLGLVLVEALGSGCPVVVSDIPAAADAISGIDGVVVVPAGSVSALACGVSRILDSREAYRRAVISSRSKLEARFDWEGVADGYTAVLESLIRR